MGCLNSLKSLRFILSFIRHSYLAQENNVKTFDSSTLCTKLRRNHEVCQFGKKLEFLISSETRTELILAKCIEQELFVKRESTEHWKFNYPLTQ